MASNKAPCTREDCERCAKRVPWVSLAGNASLAAYKIVVGVLGGSSALIVEGFHSLSDVVGSTVIVISAKVSARPADEEHPYGYGNAEFIGAIFVYTVLFFLSITIVIGAGMQLMSGDLKAPHIVTFLGAIVSVLGNYVMYMFGYCAGTRVNSPALMADAFENKQDAISSMAAVVGIALAILVHPIFDPIAAVVVGLIILWNAVHQLKDSVSNLMDRGFPAEVLDSMRDVAMTHAGVVAVDYVRTRRIGPRYWVDVRLQVAADMDVAEADAIGRNVRVDLMQRCEDFQYVEVFVVPAGARPRERHRLHVIQPTEHA